MHFPQTFKLSSLLAALLLLAAISSAQASDMTFNINANGANEVTSGGTPNQGDPDGTAIGTLTLDNGDGTGNTGFATFSLLLNNIDLTTLSGHHIHMGPITSTGGIVINFGDPDTILSGNMLSGTIMNLPAATITSVFGNPTAFYYNLHNGAFPGGAVRDQLVPEPGTYALLALGAAGFAVARRRRK